MGVCVYVCVRFIFSQACVHRDSRLPVLFFLLTDVSELLPFAFRLKHVYTAEDRAMNMFIGLTNMFIGLKNMFIGLKNMFIGLKNMFIGLKNMFIGLKNMFIGLKNMFYTAIQHVCLRNM